MSSAKFKPKRTAAASRGFLATCRSTDWKWQPAAGAIDLAVGGFLVKFQCALSLVFEFIDAQCHLSVALVLVFCSV